MRVNDAMRDILAEMKTLNQGNPAELMRRKQIVQNRFGKETVVDAEWAHYARLCKLGDLLREAAKQAEATVIYGVGPICRFLTKWAFYPNKLDIEVCFEDIDLAWEVAPENWLECNQQLLSELWNCRLLFVCEVVSPDLAVAFHQLCAKYQASVAGVLPIIPLMPAKPTATATP